MKNLFWILMLGLFMGCNTTSAPTAEPETFTEMPWTKMDKVEELVKKKPKKILVDVYTPWCGPCKMMDRMTFTDPAVINKVGKNFYPVKFNAEGADAINFMGKEYSNPGYNPARAKTRNSKHQLSSFFAVRGYPTLVVLDENMNIIDKIVGFQKPDQLMASLAKYDSK